MKHYARKITPQVKLGQVQRKNRWDATPNYYNTPQKYPVFDREKAGRGYRHLIRRQDLFKFIEIVPEWDELANGLNAVVLSSAYYGLLGWHNKGVVGICAWEKEIEWHDCSDEFYEEHEGIFGKLNIQCSKNKSGYFIEFDEASAKAFQLIHIFIHELGHHHDRMTTRSKRAVARGEEYAENYARRFEDVIIEEYRRVFNF
ncbi:hypothetical protein QUF72_06605 [Desulfobacterales bacterium HSG2]|nr:hypothetical protein [Desulfobacterales bacterium HSG2]